MKIHLIKQPIDGLDLLFKMVMSINDHFRSPRLFVDRFLISPFFIAVKLYTSELVVLLTREKVLLRRLRLNRTMWKYLVKPIYHLLRSEDINI